MDPKGKHRTSATAPSLAHADQQINLLFQKHLPAVPHIFFVPTNNPYRPTFPHENLNIPFEGREIPKLQYMTLISNGDRGVGASRGASDWEEEVYGKSPLSAAGQSSTSTPNPVRDPKKISQKISLGDYKNFKQTGVKPSPKPYTATPEHKTSHSRNTSAVSAITPMGRVPSSEGDLKPIGYNANTLAVEKAPAKELERSTVPRSVPTDTQGKDKSRPITNGHHSTPQSNTPKDLREPRAGTKSEYSHPVKEQMKHPLPPRPRSPPRNNPEPKKRALEAGETHPEKRVKIGHSESRTPLSSQMKDTARTLETTSDIKPSPTKSQKPSIAAPSSLPKKPPPPTKYIDSNGTPKLPKPDKPLHIPPLLSPLAADLEPGPEPHSVIKKPHVDKVATPKTPSKHESLGSDTIVVKQPNIKTLPPTHSPLPDPPKSSTPPFVLPRLLSPGLPLVIEEELLRLQQKSATLNTVEARHEKATLPGAPGVARKTPRNAKVGHPPKRNHGEPKLPMVLEKEAKKSLIVKIAYKKRNANDIRRILALTQKPRGQMEKLEAGERLARERSTSAAPPRHSSDSEEDVSISKSRSGKTTSAPISKKRPVDPTDRSDPAPKRPKPEIDVTKASTPVTPAFKSPAVSNPSAASQKSLLATPKKGDAMKSVAMRRVDSNDGLARTPQTTSTSTPASAEKPRSNGVSVPPNPEVEKQKALAHAAEALFFPMGTTLKRKMDALISPKNRDPSVSIPESERKVGLCIGIESLMAYMLAFQARDRVAHLRGSPPDPSTWDSFLKLHNFVVQFSKPYIELHALVEQMGALARENLDKAFMAHMGLIKDGGKVEKIARDMRENSRLREITWISVKKNEKVLRELGVKNPDILGPWSSVPDAVTLASGTLDVYSKKEKLKWSPDDQLAAARESGSSSGK